MFKIEKEVPGLELCKKLKELGYPQDGGGFYWMKLEDYKLKRDVWKLLPQEDTPKRFFVKDWVKAPTCQELGKYLKRARYFYDGEQWRVYHPRADYNIYDKLESNARAEMLIMLIKNGHIKLNKKEV